MMYWTGTLQKNNYQIFSTNNNTHEIAIKHIIIPQIIAIIDVNTLSTLAVSNIHDAQHTSLPVQLSEEEV